MSLSPAASRVSTSWNVSQSYHPSDHHHQHTATGIVKKERWTLADFDIGKKIGVGRFGKVYLARERESKCAVALKCLSKELIARHELQHQVQRECELQHYIRHKNIARLLAFFWDAERIFLVLEYCEGGDLFSFLKRQPEGRLSEHQAALFVRDIADGLRHMHSSGIIHRDVKPENILIRKGRAKLSDFTWAVQCTSAERRQTLCGTLDYLSPEVVNCANGPGYTVHADLWGLGAVLFELLTGKPPFEKQLPQETCVSIMKGHYEIPSILSAEAADLVRLLLQIDESDRLTAEGVLTHPWVIMHVQQHESEVHVEQATAASSAPRNSGRNSSSNSYVDPWRGDSSSRTLGKRKTAESSSSSQCEVFRETLGRGSALRLTPSSESLPLPSTTQPLSEPQTQPLSERDQNIYNRPGAKAPAPVVLADQVSQPSLSSTTTTCGPLQRRSTAIFPSDERNWYSETDDGAGPVFTPSRQLQMPDDEDDGSFDLTGLSIDCSAITVTTEAPCSHQPHRVPAATVSTGSTPSAISLSVVSISPSQSQLQLGEGKAQQSGPYPKVFPTPPSLSLSPGKGLEQALDDCTFGDRSETITQQHPVPEPDNNRYPSSKVDAERGQDPCREEVASEHHGIATHELAKEEKKADVVVTPVAQPRSSRVLPSPLDLCCSSGESFQRQLTTVSSEEQQEGWRSPPSPVCTATPLSYTPSATTQRQAGAGPSHADGTAEGSRKPTFSSVLRRRVSSTFDSISTSTSSNSTASPPLLSLSRGDRELPVSNVTTTSSILGSSTLTNSSELSVFSNNRPPLEATETARQGEVHAFRPDTISDNGSQGKSKDKDPNGANPDQSVNGSVESSPLSASQKRILHRMAAERNDKPPPCCDGNGATCSTAGCGVGVGVESTSSAENDPSTSPPCEERGTSPSDPSSPGNKSNERERDLSVCTTQSLIDVSASSSSSCTPSLTNSPADKPSLTNSPADKPSLPNSPADKPSLPNRVVERMEEKEEEEQRRERNGEPPKGGSEQNESQHQECGHSVLATERGCHQEPAARHEVNGDNQSSSTSTSMGWLEEHFDILDTDDDSVFSDPEVSAIL